MELHLHEFVVKLQKKRNQLAQARDRASALAAEHEQVETRLVGEERALSALVDEERDMQAEVARLRGQLAEEENRHRVLSHRLVEGRNKLRADTRKKESLDVVLHDLETRYARACDKHAADQASVDAVAAKLADMALEHSDVAARHEETRESAARKEGELAQLKEDLRQIKLVVGASIAGGSGHGLR